MTKLKTETYAGFAAILGAPNAGKSTLLNQLLGEKISIVSQKAQTTRMRVLGILTDKNTQIGLIDTPGIFMPKGKMDKAMVAAAWESLEDADAIVLLVDAAVRQPDEKTDNIIAKLKKQQRRVTLVLNKVDKIRLEKLLPLSERLNETGIFDEIFMISALTGDGVAKLKKHLMEKMPAGPWMYPEDQLTDLPERLLAAEITREQIFRQLHDELPYAATVIPDSWERKRDKSIIIRQTIIVERPNHKAIVLGKNGAQIKSLGAAARTEMAKSLGHPVHLFLEVKIQAEWQEKSQYYQLFGLDELQEQ